MTKKKEKRIFNMVNFLKKNGEIPMDTNIPNMPSTFMAPNGNRPITEFIKTDMLIRIEYNFTEILKTLNFDLTDPNIKDTPKRIAKMYIEEIFSGCYEEEPKITIFPNTKNFDQMITLGPINIKSTCSHHFQSFHGDAYISYIPSKNICGISKLARIAHWFSKRPQIQEELTEQIADYIEQKLKPKGCAVYITAKHNCMVARGVEEERSFMDTTALRGCYKKSDVKKEFFDIISMKRTS